MAPATSSMPSREPELRPWSLRRRLIGLLSAVVVAIGCSGGTLIYLEARRQSDELADRAMGEAGQVLLSVAEHELLEHGGPVTDIVSLASQAHAPYLVFQIWDAAGQLMYRSIGARNEPLVPFSNVGYSDQQMDGEAWRVFTAWDDHHALQVQLAEPKSYRLATRADIGIRLGSVLLLFVALTMFVIWMIVARVFEPLESSARDVAARSPDDLREVSIAGAPREVIPLLGSLNQLLGRVRAVLQRERMFTADAAHELRTPLAAIRTTAQVLGDARGTEEVQAAVTDLIEGVDRGSHLVEQLLVLARMDSRQQTEPVAVDLAQLLEQEVAGQRRFAPAQGIALELAASPVTVMGDEARLGILIRNLLDNAIRYTPRGGRVLASCGVRGQKAELAVSDSGIGIHAAERARVFERFYRVMGNDSPGSGLGLSIVQRIAEDHRARLELRDGLDGRGITFAVVFPKVGS